MNSGSKRSGTSRQSCRNSLTSFSEPSTALLEKQVDPGVACLLWDRYEKGKVVVLQQVQIFVRPEDSAGARTALSASPAPQPNHTRTKLSSLLWLRLRRAGPREPFRGH